MVSFLHNIPSSTCNPWRSIDSNAHSCTWVQHEIPMGQQKTQLAHKVQIVLCDTHKVQIVLCDIQIDSNVCMSQRSHVRMTQNLGELDFDLTPQGWTLTFVDFPRHNMFHLSEILLFFFGWHPKKLIS